MSYQILSRNIKPWQNPTAWKSENWLESVEMNLICRLGTEERMELIGEVMELLLGDSLSREKWGSGNGSWEMGENLIEEHCWGFWRRNEWRKNKGLKYFWRLNAEEEGRRVYEELCLCEKQRRRKLGRVYRLG
jgi:hypothetical protein